jgi:acetyl/propionyl-CoA carboxylase alpha subunit
MSVSKRRTAGAISLIGGLLLVILGSAWAPASAGQNTNPGGNQDCPSGTTQVAKFNYTNGSYVLEGSNTGGVVITSGTGTNVSWTSTVLISLIVVKGADDAGVFDVNPDAMSGSFTNEVIPLNNGGQRPAISNIKFCSPGGSSSSSSSSTTSSSGTSSSSSSRSHSSSSSRSHSSSSNSSSQQTSSQQTSSQQTSSQQTSSQQTSSQQTSSQQTSSQQTSSQQTSSQQTSSQQTSSQQTSSQQTSSQQTSSQPSVSGSSLQTSSEDTSSGSIAPSSQQNSPSDSVGGVKVSRPGAQQLPRTGMDPGFMLMMGGALVVAGVLMLRYSDTASA